VNPCYKEYGIIMVLFAVVLIQCDKRVMNYIHFSVGIINENDKNHGYTATIAKARESGEIKSNRYTKKG